MIRQDTAQVKQDFYDGLYLNGLLQMDSKRRVKSGERDLPRIETPRTRNEWELFLDDICLLCDSSPGGATVTAISVEQGSIGTTFWVCSDFNNNKDLEPYLDHLLRTIHDGTRHSDIDSHRTREIFSNAVSRSPQRVNNYACRLKSAVKSLEIAQAAAHEERNIRTALIKLVDLRHDHVELCAEAHRLRQDSDIRDFLREKRSRYDSWFQIHHYLARLGSWHRAARCVLELGRLFPQVLAAFTVCCVPLLSNLERTAPAFGDDPEVVLERVCPNYKGTAILANAKIAIATAQELAQRYQQAVEIPMPHAETQVLSHFFRCGLSFVGENRYVGCSKPSCYSCAKYFRFHPMRARTGRIHNNVWIKWGLPSVWIGDDEEVERHSLRMMRVMADSMRNDVIALILGESVQPGAMFDSTTGLTTSVQALSS